MASLHLLTQTCAIMKINKKRAEAKAANKKIKGIAKVENGNEVKPRQSKSEKASYVGKPNAKAPVTRGNIGITCQSCNMPVFGKTRNSTDICKCSQNCYFGCFWQRPVGKKIDTIACYREGDKTYWMKICTKRGPSGMIVGIPGGRLRFKPSNLATPSRARQQQKPKIS